VLDNVVITTNVGKVIPRVARGDTFTQLFIPITSDAAGNVIIRITGEIDAILTNFYPIGDSDVTADWDITVSDSLGKEIYKNKAVPVDGDPQIINEAIADLIVITCANMGNTKTAHIALTFSQTSYKEIKYNPVSLADGQLPNASATIYTHRDALGVEITWISLFNTNTTAETITLSVKRFGSASRLIARFVLAQNESGQLVGPISLSNGDIIEGATTTAVKVDYLITGNAPC